MAHLTKVFNNGLGPNWDDHDKNTCLIINYLSDRKNTELILLRQEIEIENGCYYCNNCKKCKKLKEYKKEFKKMGFWTFNKHVKVWDIFDPDWSIKSRDFSMEPL